MQEAENKTLKRQHNLSFMMNGNEIAYSEKIQANEQSQLYNTFSNNFIFQHSHLPNMSTMNTHEAGINSYLQQVINRENEDEDTFNVLY